MNTSRDVETAIDHVAAKMVAVKEDPELVTRIVGALPDRSRFTWLIPQFAALSAIAIAAVMWSMRERPATAVLPSIELATAAPFRAVAIAREPGTMREPETLREPGTQPLERLEPLQPLAPDFERSLPPLMVTELTPVELPESPGLVLAPIGVADLPLTADFPPR